MAHGTPHWFRHTNYIAVGKLKASMNNIYRYDKQISNLTIINGYCSCISNLHGRALCARAPPPLRSAELGPTAPGPGWLDVCDGVGEQGRIATLSILGITV